MSSPAVSAELIKLLSDNYFKHVHITRESGKVEPLDKDIDSTSIWFSKENIDQLFADNGYKPGDTDYGLRIYFGVHDKSKLLKDIPEEDDNRLMTILVATKGPADKPVDLLKGISADDQLTAGGELSGEGLDSGKICPPMVCGSI
ncbi:hypothetical protein A0256_06560 [Mucilaginibacter sp. PAMC 26640]|nr:hypothetical protein A0256_06560 [Mucilaginibacter sp. PAMC 26640]